MPRGYTIGHALDIIPIRRRIPYRVDSTLEYRDILQEEENIVSDQEGGRLPLYASNKSLKSIIRDAKKEAPSNILEGKEALVSTRVNVGPDQVWIGRKLPVKILTVSRDNIVSYRRPDGSIGRGGLEILYNL